MEKVARFEGIINKEADEEINALLSKAREKAEEAVACADKQYLEESYRIVSEETASIKRKLEHMVSQKSYRASKDFFAHRSKRVDEFFEGLEKEIIEFSNTSEYEQRLKSIIEEINSERAITKTSTVYVRASDVQKAEKLFPDFKIEADKNIKLGGATVFYPENSVYIDKTLDSAFNGQRSEFVKNSVMQ